VLSGPSEIPNTSRKLSALTRHATWRLIGEHMQRSPHIVCISSHLILPPFSLLLPRAKPSSSTAGHTPSSLSNLSPPLNQSGLYAGRARPLRRRSLPSTSFSPSPSASQARPGPPPCRPPRFACGAAAQAGEPRAAHADAGRGASCAA
jgi:hypothetical protein